MENNFLENKILLNSGRNCLRYILKSLKIKEIQLPYYICPVVRQAIHDENVKMNFYHINKNFLPAKQFSKNDFILYPNYFGLCDLQAKILSEKYPNFISDNAHAFFAPKRGIATFSSPRKFFNVNDGGILEINAKIPEIFDVDEDRSLEIKDFDSFCKNEISLDNEPIKLMSKKTQKSLKNINFEQKIMKNHQIYTKIAQKLDKTNILNFEISPQSAPMCYPFLSKNFNKELELAKNLEKEGIYLIKYGSNLPKSYEEFDLTKILMIPLTKKSSEYFEQM